MNVTYSNPSQYTRHTCMNVTYSNPSQYTRHTCMSVTYSNPSQYTRHTCMSVTYSNPRVSENIFNLVTLLWICLQQSPDQILGCMREKRPLLQEGRAMTNKPHSNWYNLAPRAPPQLWPPVSLKYGRPGTNLNVWRSGMFTEGTYPSYIIIVKQLQTHICN